MYLVFTRKIGIDTAENEPLELTDSGAGENRELVVSRPLKADLLDLEKPCKMSIWLLS